MFKTTLMKHYICKICFSYSRIIF